MGIRRKAGQNQISIDIYFFYHPIFAFLLPVTISSISSISVYLFSLYLRTLPPFPADLLNDVRAGGYGAEAGLISCRTEFLLLKKGLIGGLILN